MTTRTRAAPHAESLPTAKHPGDGPSRAAPKTLGQQRVFVNRAETQVGRTRPVVEDQQANWVKRSTTACLTVVADKLATQPTTQQRRGIARCSPFFRLTPPLCCVLGPSRNG